MLGTMYDNLMEVVRLRPGTVVAPSVVGAVQETYELVAQALRRANLPRTRLSMIGGNC